jgi:hypothetical protein
MLDDEDWHERGAIAFWLVRAGPQRTRLRLRRTYVIGRGAVWQSAAGQSG